MVSAFVQGEESDSLLQAATGSVIKAVPVGNYAEEMSGDLTSSVDQRTLNEVICPFLKAVSRKGLADSADGKFDPIFTEARISKILDHFELDPIFHKHVMGVVRFTFENNTFDIRKMVTFKNSKGRIAGHLKYNSGLTNPRPNSLRMGIIRSHAQNGYVTWKALHDSDTEMIQETLKGWAMTDINRSVEKNYGSIWWHEYATVLDLFGFDDPATGERKLSVNEFQDLVFRGKFTRFNKGVSCFSGACRFPAAGFKKLAGQHIHDRDSQASWSQAEQAVKPLQHQTVCLAADAHNRCKMRFSEVVQGYADMTRFCKRCRSKRGSKRPFQKSCEKCCDEQCSFLPPWN